MIVSVLDTVAFSAILSASLLFILPIRRKSIQPLLIVLVVVALTVTIHLYKGRAIREKNKKSANEEDRFIRLMMMRDDEIAALLHTDSFYMIRKIHPDVFDFLNAMKSGAATIGIFDRADLNHRVMTEYLQNRMVLDRRELLNLTSSGTERREGAACFIKPAIRNKFNKYLLLAFILFVCSFFVRYKIYYRSVSCICAFLAPISGFFHDSGLNKNLRIFLDKKEGG